MNHQKLRVAILDDFEKIADTVPAYEKLKERADVTLLRKRLDGTENLVTALRDYDVLLLMRERTFLATKNIPSFRISNLSPRPGAQPTSRFSQRQRHGIAIADPRRHGMSRWSSPSR